MLSYILCQYERAVDAFDEDSSVCFVLALFCFITLEVCPCSRGNNQQCKHQSGHCYFIGLWETARLAGLDVSRWLISCQKGGGWWDSAAVRWGRTVGVFVKRREDETDWALCRGWRDGRVNFDLLGNQEEGSPHLAGCVVWCWNDFNL